MTRQSSQGQRQQHSLRSLPPSPAAQLPSNGCTDGAECDPSLVAPLGFDPTSTANRNTYVPCGTCNVSHRPVDLESLTVRSTVVRGQPSAARAAGGKAAAFDFDLSRVARRCARILANRGAKA